MPRTVGLAQHGLLRSNFKTFEISIYSTFYRFFSDLEQIFQPIRYIFEFFDTNNALNFMKQTSISRNYRDRSSFLRGFFYVFGITEHSLSKAVEQIQKKDAASALHDDKLAIANDFNRVFHKEAELVDVE